MVSSNYTFERAWQEGDFLQQPLITGDELKRAAAERGKSGQYMLLGDRELEELDRLGSVRPVAFSLGPYMGASLYPHPGMDIVFHNQESYHPWDEYKWQLDDYPHLVMSLYSPWQLLYLTSALDLRTANPHVGLLLDDDALGDFVERTRPFWQARFDFLSSMSVRNHKLMLTLVRLQNQYLPEVTGRRVVGYGSGGAEVVVDSVERWRTPPDEVALELGVTAEEIRKARDGLLLKANSLDPVERLRPLLDEMGHSKRQKLLTGTARQAEDLYTAARVLELFLHDWTGEELPHPRTGAKTLELTSAAERAQLLVYYGLYPHRAQVMVEGPSDKALLDALMREALGGMDPTGAGVRIDVLDGTGAVASARERLETFKEYTGVVVFVLDNEGDVKSTLRKWVADGVLNEDHLFVWDHSIEEDNFSDEELVQMAHQLAAARGFSLELSAQALRQTCEARRQKTGARVGLLGVLVGMMGNPERGAVVVKKDDFAPLMVRMIVEDLASRGWDEVANARQILRVIALLQDAIDGVVRTPPQEGQA